MPTVTGSLPVPSPALPATAVLFDLDDTLLPDDAATAAALLATCEGGEGTVTLRQHSTRPSTPTTHGCLIGACADATPLPVARAGKAVVRSRQMAAR